MKNNTTKTEIFFQNIGFRFSKEPIKLVGETTPIFRADRPEPYYMPFVVVHSADAPQEAMGYIAAADGEMYNIRSLIKTKSKVPVFSTKEEASKIVKISMKYILDGEMFKDRQLFVLKEEKNKTVTSKATAKNQFDDTLFMSSLKQLSLEQVAKYAVDEKNQEVNTLSKTTESMIDTTLKVSQSQSQSKKINMKNPSSKDIEVMESVLSGKFALSVMRGVMEIMKEKIDDENFREHIQSNDLEKDTEEFVTNIGDILANTADTLKKEIDKGGEYNEVLSKISENLKLQVENLTGQELKFTVATGAELKESNSDLDAIFDKKQASKNKEYAKQLEQILNTSQGEEMLMSAGKQLAVMTLYNKDLISKEMFEEISQESSHPNTIASVKTRRDDDIMDRLTVAPPTKESESESEKQIINLFKRYSKEQMQSLVDSIGMDKLEKRYGKNVIKIIKDNLN